MKKLFVFGDSFSASFKPDDNVPIEDFRHQYIKWLGYVPRSYGEVMSEKLNLELINRAVGGYSNSSIFQSICMESTEINDGDIIVIGWTIIERFRLADPNTNKWVNFNTYLNDGDYSAAKSISMDNQTVNQILVNRSTTQYKDELFNWVKLINVAFKKNKIFHWSWDNNINTDIISKPVDQIRQIRVDTDGAVNDRHWGEDGHKSMASYVIGKLIPKII